VLGNKTSELKAGDAEENGPSPDLDFLSRVSEQSDDPLLYQQLFDNAVVGISFMIERRFVRVNRRMEELLGYCHDELIGQSTRLVYAREEDFEEIGRRITVISHRRSYTYETLLVTKSGEFRWCLVGLRWINSDSPHSPLVAIVQDLTSHKATADQLARAKIRLEEKIAQRTLNLQKTNQALKEEVLRRRNTERAMIESREKYRVLMKNIPLGIVVTDTEGSIAEINSTMQTWFRASDLDTFIGAASIVQCKICGEMQSQSLLELIQSCMLNVPRQTGHITVALFMTPEETLWFDVGSVRLPVNGLGAAVVFTDITAQRKARDRELAQQQKVAHAARISIMGQFASALAHELGQPLNSSLCYAEGISRHLADELANRPEAAQALEHLQLHLHQAGEIIKNVRTFVTRHHPADEQVDFTDLIHSTLDLLQVQLRESSTHVHVDTPSAIPRLPGNRVELQQVLVNLIVNAIDAMRDIAPRQREVNIAVKRLRGRHLQIIVSDNGPGIPEEMRDQIFEPYHSTKKDGLGLGLTMCRNIIESHGGKLNLESRKRSGAAFRFTLPENTSDDTLAPARRSRQPRREERRAPRRPRTQAGHPR
jgi:PAS domain S-box-containing protein